MNLRSSILTIGLSILILTLLLFTILNYDTLNANEGWGMVGVVSIGAWTLGGFVVDIIIKNVFKNKDLQLVLRSVVLAFYIFLYWSFIGN